MITSNKTVFKLLSAFFLSFFLLFVFVKSTEATCIPNKRENQNVTVSADCSIAQDDLEVIDVTNSEDSNNSGSLTIDSGALFTINEGSAGTTRLNVGSITISNGTLSIAASKTATKLNQPVWVTDDDDDGWASDFTISESTASGKRRLGLMKSMTETDCDDGTFSSDNTCYSYSQSTYWSYGYSQGGYWRYGYNQSTYWRYVYSQGNYWSYGYGQSFYGCFTAGTKVLMADGTYKEIQNIRAGDEVMSYDLKTGKLVKDKVNVLLIHPDTPGGVLVINNYLEVTPNHRMWIENRNEWARADTLKVGDTLLNPEGEAITVSSIEEVEGTNDVYNLSLPGENHNYFTEDILVHNWK